MLSQVWLITGASRGLGLSIAQAVLERGGTVIAAARDRQRAREALGASERVFPVEMDVTDGASIQNAAATVLRRFGKIDVLVNNAGYGLIGAIEELEPAEIEGVFKTNFFGVHQVLRAFLPALRARRAGWIVNISSVGGFSASAGAGAYNASKFALEGLSEALAQELTPLGIRVLIVEPGYLRTDFLDDSMRTAKTTLADYAETAGRTVKLMAERNRKQPGDPRKAARAIVNAVESAHPPLRLILGPDAVERVANKLAAVRRDLDGWREVAMSTDFDRDPE
ncbi:MAG TPA: oxidoreductase [Candidatus Binataceae bacterium]|nr:oxidoreductase [Candidatus Binataceae bacterium]